MRNIYRIATLSILLIGTSHNFFAQDVIDKLSNEICKCLEKKEIKNADDLGPCFEDTLMNNWSGIKTYYNVQSLEEKDMEQLGIKIGTRLLKECQYMADNFSSDNEETQEIAEKQSDLTCEDLKNGDFYYVLERPRSQIKDTTYVTISNDMFLERMKNGKTYSLLNIKWKDNCKFDLIFKESNDPMKKEFSEPGDIYNYEILTNTDKSVFIKTTWMNRTLQFELVKMDKSMN